MLWVVRPPSAVFKRAPRGGCWYVDLEAEGTAGQCDPFGPANRADRAGNGRAVRVAAAIAPSCRSQLQARMFGKEYAGQRLCALGRTASLHPAGGRGHCVVAFVGAGVGRGCAGRVYLSRRLPCAGERLHALRALSLARAKERGFNRCGRRQLSLAWALVVSVWAGAFVGAGVRAGAFVRVGSGQGRGHRAPCAEELVASARASALFVSCGTGVRGGWVTSWRCAS